MVECIKKFKLYFRKFTQLSDHQANGLEQP